MNIVGVAACPVGIAHTYIARDRLLKAAEYCGHKCKIETQGSIGPENVLTAEEIKLADVVILATDVSVSGEERFAGKSIVHVSTSVALKNPLELIKKIEKKLQDNKK
jgi:fructose PTS system EIIB component